VLGASGFLGRHLVQRLSDAGVETVTPSSRDFDLSGPGATVALTRLLRPTDSIVFLAATKLGLRLDDDGFVANAAMGAALCNAVRQTGCAHVVYLSSDAVYPFTDAPIREDSATASTSLYALMHLARETMLRNVGGLPVVMLRATQVYGAGDPHGAYGPRRMVRSALTEGRIMLYGEGRETRDHIHVGDVTSVIAEALARRTRGLVNVATGRSTSFAALADLVARSCGGPVAIGQEPPRMPVMHRCFDTSALQAAFPNRTDTSLERGIAALIEEERSAGDGVLPASLRRPDPSESAKPHNRGPVHGAHSRDPDARRASEPSFGPAPERDRSR
jgi:nucleoside-diphosphate-sugar epimerase